MTIDTACPPSAILTAIPMRALLGLTLTSVQHHPDGLRLVTRTGKVGVIMHEQECCEIVDLIDVCGDPADLLGSPITVAEARTSSVEPKPGDVNGYGHDSTSATWTFIELATVRGSVTLRFYGSSNGYYSETASLYLAERIDA